MYVYLHLQVGLFVLPVVWRVGGATLAMVALVMVAATAAEGIRRRRQSGGGPVITAAAAAVLGLFTGGLLAYMFSCVLDFFLSSS